MAMKGAKLLFVASWVILLVLCGALMIFSLLSLSTAYFSNQDTLYSGDNGPASVHVGLEEIRQLGGDGAVKAFKGRRATAATWAVGFSLLAGLVTFFPYRRGEKWAWWALLVSMGLSQFLSLSRLVTIGTASGAGTSGIILALFLLGLLAGVPHMFARRIEDVIIEE
jgi:hypothetical protein